MLMAHADANHAVIKDLCNNLQEKLMMKNQISICRQYYLCKCMLFFDSVIISQ